MIRKSLTAIDYEGKINISKNDQGKTVYELPYQIADQFTTLFGEIDENKEQYGIKDYTLRSSTLEEVFITLGEMEKKKEMNEGGQIAIEQEDNGEDFNPEVQETSFGQLFKANFKLHYLSSYGYFCYIIIVILATVIFSLAGLQTLFAFRNLNGPINYTDMASIYSQVEPMDAYYNSQVDTGTTSDPTEFMNSLSSVAGSNTLNLTAKAWPAYIEG